MATKWLSASDPYFQQFPGTQDEGGFQPGQYAGQIAGLNNPAMWAPLAKQLGYTGEIMGVVGTDAEGGALTDYSNEFKNFIAQKKAEGYDLVTDASKIDQRKQTVGLRLPSGQVVGERSVDAGGFGEFLQAAMMMFGPVFGGQIFNALTGAGTAAGSALGATNALTPAAIEAGLGTAGYGANASAAASGLFNPAVIGAGAGTAAGSALGIAEGMAPGVLAPATAAEMYGVNALLGSGGAGALTAADLASLPPDVMGGVSPNVGYENLGQIQPLANETFMPVTAEGTGVTNALNYQPPPANALAQGAYQNLSPTDLLSLDYATTPNMGMSPIGRPTPYVAPLSGTATGAGAPYAGALADLAGGSADLAGATGGGLFSSAGGNALGAAGAGAGAIGGSTVTAPTTAATGAGIMEGMVPGGLTSAGIPATLAEAGAAGAVAAGAGAGGSILDQAINLIKSPAGGAILSGVGSAVGGIMQANAAEAAAEQQAGAAQNALALQREMFEYQKGLLEPYRTAGTSALKRLEGALGLGGQAQPQQMLEMDPGYGFRLGEGMKALERMQAARGNMLSGGAMKAGQQYAQNYASGEYGNAYNRLANIAGLGQTTGTQLGTAAQQFGTNASGVMGQEANALAAGRVGRGSAYAGGVQGGLNAYSNYLNQQQQNQMFRDIFGRTAIGG